MYELLSFVIFGKMINDMIFLESLDINDAGELRESTGWLHPFS
jgi:hypothetical protein